ncbi:NAD(P)/FAD-dependent oxidoreductase [Calothrix sp. PCC 6303]|uniref:NAD(P)/FAD-dependent oxidoreductase n=1 Tax=Calothrix sp. PCC 6303 TaxID=1170562 RepID=UPI0002A0362C|nr:FAD-dependent oxidoreductase [Calothrix sp. PCC 6303]AFZ02465.1 amine oxidase [Calothrix sp. PCC 6303]
MTDIAVIGAGIAGLACAQQLNQAGYSVVVVEKSRGLGGRVATRRLHGTIADHGACFLKPKDEFSSQFVESLCQRDILRIWEGEFIEQSGDASTQPRYIAPAGMSAIAKPLARGLNVILNQRVIAINPTLNHQWYLTLSANNEIITAKALVIAIPAPQALELLEPLENNLINSQFIHQLRSVEFIPSISVMAGYPTTSQPLPPWQALTLEQDSILGWIGFDSSKRLDASQPVFVVQSSANFAIENIDTEDLQPFGNQMLQTAAQLTKLFWLENPEWLQVHRWRYAFPRKPLTTACLTAETPLPLVCCGDWCGGNLIPGAIKSGLAAAKSVNSQMKNCVMQDKLSDFSRD